MVKTTRGDLIFWCLLHRIMAPLLLTIITGFSRSPVVELETMVRGKVGTSKVFHLFLVWLFCKSFLLTFV